MFLLNEETVFGATIFPKILPENSYHLLSCEYLFKIAQFEFGHRKHRMPTFINESDFNVIREVNGNEKYNK